MITVASPTEGKVAIVAAALRLPGADSLASYRDNLLAGRDCVTRDAGADADPEPGSPAGGAVYVRAYGRIAGAAGFDPGRFGMSPAEALLTDPQQRIALELVDEALHRGALSTAQRANAAVFLGTGMNGYEAAVRRHLLGAPGVDDMAVELGTARDYAAGKLAYRLDLHGPAVNVLAACSTALVAVHMACRSLLGGECDAAVAAVSTVQFPERRGYWAVPGSIGSMDGVCRPFDARASGSVPADGAGALVLKRLDDALAAGDPVLAVIRGSAANNDGRKGGFAEVSTAAQERVITQALRAAGVDARAVRYVESHGSATRLGDAVEWATLRKVFGRNQAPLHVGAVKGNLGHTREAAGLAGLIKAIAALQAGTVPPTANFEALPMDLEDPDSPVVPVAAPAALEPGAIVGVSAFGLGGTNCHVVLEAAPPRPAPVAESSRLILLSSHHAEALEGDTEAVRALAAERPQAVAGVAARSRTRHHAHPVRRALRVSGEDGAQLLDLGSRRAPRRAEKVVFAFSGAGSGYVGMGNGLARRYEVFRRTRDDVVRLAAEAGVELGPTFDPARGVGACSVDFKRMLAGGGKGEIADVAVTHLSLFAVHMALFDLFADAGVRPAAVLGHSVGEWAAATAAGALERAEAVRLLALRARLIEQAPPGVTLAVGADAQAVAPLLDEGSVIAADNSPASCLVSALAPSVAALEERMRAAGLVIRRLPTETVFHHPALRDAGLALREAVEGVEMRDPIIPMISTVTGTWVAPGELGGAYWEAQLARPVRFRDALGTVSAGHKAIVELGPGSIRPWVVQAGLQIEALRTLPLSFEGSDDAGVTEQAWAELWMRGHDVRWSADPALRASGAEDDPKPVLRRTDFDPRAANGASPAPAVPAASIPSPTPAPVAQVRAEAEAAPVDRGPRGAASREELAERLGEIWAALLGAGRVAMEDDFFELGGDSLLAHHLIGRLEDLYHVRVPGPVVFAATSLGGMAGRIHAWLEEAAAAHA